MLGRRRKIIIPRPKCIEHSESVTRVVWDDDTETTVKCMEGDYYDKYAAFCAAVAKRIYGGNGAVKKIWKRAEKAEPEPLDIGDEVVILDGSKIPNYAGGWSEFIMSGFVGETYKITDVFNCGDNLAAHLDIPFWGNLTFDRRGLKKVIKYEKG